MVGLLFHFTWDLEVLGTQTANANDALDFSRGCFQKMNTGLYKHEDLSPESQDSCKCMVGAVTCWVSSLTRQRRGLQSKWQ